MKTILITVGQFFVARNLLRTDFLKCLKETPDLKIVFLVPKNKVDFYQTEFGSENVIIDTIPPEPPLSFPERLYKVAATESVSTRSRKIIQYRYLYDTEAPFYKKTLYFLFSRICWYLGKFKLWRKFLQSVYGLIPSPDHYYPIFDRYKPDLVFSTYLIGYQEFRLLKQAKKRKIKTVSQILSWDNLTTKVFICLKPDRFIVPTSLVKEELVKYGFVKKEDIFITGLPQYDEYFRKDLLLPKELFFSQIGADPTKKLILYACVGKFASPKYFDIFEQLHELVVNKKINQPVQIMIRPYPKREFTEEEKEKIKNYKFLLDKPTISLGNSGTINLELRRDGIIHLANLIYHSDLVITSFSTIIFDACIFDKPVIDINYDGHKDRPYWLSVKRMAECEHHQPAIKAKGEWSVKNPEELIRAINEYLSEPKLHQEGRKKIVEEQLYFTDGKSGERMARFILENIP